MGKWIIIVIIIIIIIIIILSSTLCRAFTIIYLKQTVFLVYIVAAALYLQ
jgi:hypothetical protein